MKNNKPLAIINNPSECECFADENESEFTSGLRRNKRKANSHWLSFEMDRIGYVKEPERKAE